MKIVFISTNADLAGAPKHVLDLAEGLVQKKVECTFFFGEKGPISEACATLGYRVVIENRLRSTINPWNDFLSLISILRIVRSIKPDFIHAHSTKAGMISRIVGFITRKPVIYTIHGWGFGSGRRRLVSFLVYWVEVLLKRLTFLYIAVSEHDRQVGLGAVGIRDEKIITIHNGIKSNNCIPKQENVEWDCIMVARDDPQKDYDTLLKAAALASFKLAVVGKGTDSPEFLMRARVFSGSGFNNISFLGIRGDVQSLLCKSHLFILSSNFEGLPLSVIEGMACGLPVIASDVGGLSELVAQENGVLFKSGDHIKLASIISDYLNNPEIIQLHGRASRIKFEKYFSREIMLNKTFEVYSSVVK